MSLAATELVSFTSPFAQDALALYHKAFPPAELVPEEDIARLVGEGKIQATAFHDGDVFLGGTISMHWDDIFYLVFLATHSQQRGRGVGGAILNYYRDLYPQHRHILELETLDDDRAPNGEQRVARERFYLRHGFRYAGFSSVEEGGVFDFLIRGGDISLGEVKEMIEEKIGAWQVELIERPRKSDKHFVWRS
ncbi:GNAT family N-acetyltransferase [Arcanobacterium canis]|uniref:GNAT family N-acetyltransferase n=1 Tax=Arcanobacterium canis TaxID=999183 RepID=A0ABY8G1H2_9ACTO|nr:GNAT family N-acetyltransferase [Arcanobacterium canis]WFM83938.1 GNAT family N-acetyltransferase [Arcanobacterium canis]